MPKLKKWILKKLNREALAKSATISSELGIGRVLSDILVQRGYETPEDASNFLKKATMFFHDPFLMNDMQKGVERIFKAIDRGERITIYGDYDVDGVTSVSTLYLYLTDKGAKVDIYIPNRAGEGYGMNLPALDKLAANGTNLIITVDTGITAIEEAKYLKKLGMEMVVTDHHHCQEQLPEAVAVINPRRPDNTYPFEELAGVGVVFKLLCALEKTYQSTLGNNGTEYLTEVCQKYCDLVAIGTIADVMPLRDENRLICAAGLRNIEKRPREGLRALMEQLEPKNPRHSRYPKKRKINTTYIGFTIAPKINAAGRLGDAMDGVRLFLSDSKSETDAIAEKLCNLNVQRQAEENRIAAEAIELAESTHDFEKDSVLVLAKENWHHGVIGIVASRLTERYNMPTLLITIEDGIGKGSGRSIKGINLVEAMNYCEDLLCKFGGHELAAGLTIQRCNVDAFRKRINEYVRTHIAQDQLRVTCEADCEVKIEELTMQLALELYRLEPYGVSNPTPTFFLRDIMIRKIIPISGGKHTKLVVEKDGISFYAMYFNMSAYQLSLYEGNRVDMMFTLDINEYRNLRSLQLYVQEIRLSEAYCRELEYEKRRLPEIRGGAAFSPEENFLPCRDDVAAVYTYLRNEARLEHTLLSERVMLASLNATAEQSIGYGKFFCSVDILSSLGLCTVEQEENGYYRINVTRGAGKTSLENSDVLRRLRKQCDRA